MRKDPDLLNCGYVFNFRSTIWITNQRKADGRSRAYIKGDVVPDDIIFDLDEPYKIFLKEGIYQIVCRYEFLKFRWLKKLRGYRQFLKTDMRQYER